MSSHPRCKKMVSFSQTYLCNSEKFRSSFKLSNFKSILHWFPGHMGKGMKQMQQKLKTVDCIVEVHDARIPFSGRNPDSFKTISGLRPHILVYNKKDLCNMAIEKEILRNHKENGLQSVIFTNCKDDKCKGVRSLIPTVQKLILSSQRYNRAENQDYCVMIIGIPNVGKSTIINVLRNRYLLKSNAVAVGAVPGITRSVGQKVKVCDDPLIYILDTPGILSPKVPSVDVGMRLALCATIPDKEVGVEIIADYLLFWLNKNGNFSYVDFLGIKNPSDDISEVLMLSALNSNFTIKVKDVENKYVIRPDLRKAAYNFVTAFRKGLFGKVTLDTDMLIPARKEFIVERKRFS